MYKKDRAGRAGRVGQAGRVFLKFFVIGMAFAAFLIWGLTIAEDSVNHLMGRAADRAVFHIGESPNGQLELILLGERYLGPSITETLQTWKNRWAGLAVWLGDGWQYVRKQALSWCETIRLRPTPAGEK